MLLTARHLTIGYGDYIVQQDLTLDASAGSMICMLGKNGCGKSTLLRTMAGLQPPLSGEIRIEAEGETTYQIDAIDCHQRAKLLSLVLTERLSMDNTSVHDVVAMGRYPYSTFLGKLSAEDEQHISTAMEQTGIAEKSARFFNCLSDGEKQRVLIAKALAQQTPLILLDEPTAHLDLNNRIRILLLLRELAHKTKRCVVISTHELDLALQTADTIWLMTPHQGSIKGGIETGTPEALTASGAFQNAFQDDSFSFLNDNGVLRIEITQCR